MRLFFTILAIALFLSVMCVPNDTADWQVCVLWCIWVPCALYISNLIFKRLEDDDMK